jgi:hypothetical protein
VPGARHRVGKGVMLQDVLDSLFRTPCSAIADVATTVPAFAAIAETYSIIELDTTKAASWVGSRQAATTGLGGLLGATADRRAPPPPSRRSL